MLIAAVMSLMAAGCGDSEGETTAALTKSQFVKKAEAICESGKREREKTLGALSAKYPPDASEAEKEEAIRLLIQPYEKMANRLGELGAPAGEEEDVQTMVAEMKSAVAQVNANPQTALVSDVPFREANRSAEEFGLENCTV